MSRSSALLLVALLAMAGCRDTSPRAGDGARIELTYWPAANPIEVAVGREMAALYEAQHPDVHITVQPIPAGRSSEEVLLAAIVARATPDVCSNISSSLLARLVRANGVVRLDTRASTKERLDERMTDAMTAQMRLPDGGLYAMPWKTNPTMLMYNVDLLAAANVRPPRTHSELVDAFRRLARDDDGDGRFDHWAMWANLKTTWFERFYDFYPLYLAGSGGVTMVAHGEPTFDNPAAVAAIEVFRKGFASKWLPRANFAGRDPFVDGTVAMKMIGPSFVEELQRKYASKVHFDVVPVPVPDDAPADAGYAFADIKSIAVFSTTKHPEEAARFVAFLSSPEADRRLIESTAQLPYRRGVAGDPRFAEALARWSTLAKYASLIERTRDVDPDTDVVEIFDIVSEGYEAAAIHNTISPEAALHDAAREARAVLHVR